MPDSLPELQSVHSEKPAEQIIAEAVTAHIGDRLQRLTENFGRVASLVKLSETLTDQAVVQSRDDVLRAAVVLLHAAVEDFLRGIASSHLPLAAEATLNQIPLAGLGTTGRPEKFFLGKLALHRGKSVDQVIAESVEQSLEQSNFNSAKEVASLLNSIGLDVSQVQSTFPDLDAMMKRRHQIVHRADRIVPGDGEPERPQSISPADVLRWMDTAVTFHTKLLAALTVADLAAGRLQIDLSKFIASKSALDDIK